MSIQFVNVLAIFEMFDTNSLPAMFLKLCRQVQEANRPKQMTINEVTVTSFREQVEIYFPTLDSFLWLTCLTAQGELYLLYSLVKRLLTPWTDFTLSSFKVHCLYVADPTLHFALNSAMCLWMIKNVMSTTAAYPVGGESFSPRLCKTE